MNYLKKMVSFVVVSFVVICSMFAIELPTGQEASIRNIKQENGKIIAVILAAPVTFKTFFGDAVAMANTRVDFYESGVLKSFFSDSTYQVKTKVGSFSIKSYRDSVQNRSKPIEFYEDGSLKSAMFSSSGNPIVSTPIGSLQAFPNSWVSFFENGDINSLYPVATQKIAFSNLTGNYVRSKKLIFYRNGSINEIYSNSDNGGMPFGLSAKKERAIVFSEDNKILRFTPVDGSTVSIGGFKFLIKEDTELELNENGMIKSCVLDCTFKDFSIGNAIFLFKSVCKEGESVPSVFVHFTFGYDSENVPGPVVLSAESYKVSQYKDPEPLPCKVSDTVFLAKSFKCNKEGKLHCVFYAVTEEFASAKDKNTYYEMYSCYFSDDGKTKYYIGKRNYDSPENNFYDSSSRGIFIMNNNSIVKEISDDINSESELFFDDNGNLKSYTIDGGYNNPMVEKNVE